MTSSRYVVAALLAAVVWLAACDTASVAPAAAERQEAGFVETTD